MAIEAMHLNLFPQILCNREMMLNGVEGMINIYGPGMMYGGLSPMTGTAARAAEMMFPTYGTVAMEAAPPMAKNVTLKAESGITCANIPVVSRKRSREDSNNSININQLASYQSALQNQSIYGGNNSSSTGQFTFLGEDFSSQIQRQQLEVDSFIAHHNEKVRLEIEERRKRYSRSIMASVEEGMMKKLRAKDVEIQKVVKLNFALEERVKSLCVENQIWRDLAQTNEATANVLRNNLEQVLVQVENKQHENGGPELVDDAESCCGSNDNEKRTLDGTTVEGSNEGSSRLCRSCGKDEACVLLLPCRHLCLCSVCGSSQHICPICKTTKNCSLHVNLAS